MQLQTVSAQPTMSSREIAELTGKDHFHVMRDLRSMQGQLGAMFGGSIQKWIHPQNGQEYDEFLLDKDTSLTLLLGYDAVARMKVVKRWQELEAAHAPALPNFADPVAAARAWADAKEGEQKAAAQLALAAPKVDFVDKYVQASTGSKGFRQVCKLLNVKEPVFRQFLKDKGVMYYLGREWVPHAQHIDAGRFETKAGVAEHGDSSHAYNQSMFTAKGVSWIAGEWAKHQVAQATATEGAA